MNPGAFAATLRFQTGKTGVPGKPRNHADLRAPGFENRRFLKPGHRENRTISELAGILPPSGREDLPGFCAEVFPCWPHQAGDFYPKGCDQMTPNDARRYCENMVPTEPEKALAGRPAGRALNTRPRN